MDSIAILERPPLPGKYAAAVLAVLMHVGLAVFLIYGIRWQVQVQEAVEVELVSSVPAVQKQAPAPEPEPVVKPEPKPEPKVEPKPEPRPTPAKPDILLKEKEKPKTKAPEKPQPKEEPKVKKEPPPPKRDLFKEAMEKEEKARKPSPTPSPNAQMSAIDRELAQMKAAQAGAAQSKAKGAWGEKIAASVRGRIIPPPDIKGNPEAVFTVVLLPSREVLSVKLKKSSGNPAWDAATERAILKSSPLPPPDDPKVFQRDLELKFRPHEE